MFRTDVKFDILKTIISHGNKFFLNYMKMTTLSYIKCYGRLLLFDFYLPILHELIC